MSLFHLAWQNFMMHVRRYGALILSLAFTIFIFFNFENLEYSGSSVSYTHLTLPTIRLV